MLKRSVKPPTAKLSDQVERRVVKANKAAGTRKKVAYDGNLDRITSTGSTLLDLAISGGIVHGGGIPSGIMVEIFGPSGTGKTVLLCQIAGNAQAKGGQVLFNDPEARLDKQFARMFGLDKENLEYTTPDTVTEVFKAVRDWEPESTGVNVVCADSLAALSTNLEMGEEDGDKMGMRRAKEFSEESRKTCRILKQKDILFVCSNQVRVDKDAGPFGQKFKAPGGEAIGFYASLRLRCKYAVRITDKKKIGSKEHKRVVGVSTEIEVYKSSVWSPYREATVDIIYDYGIDDIRANLRFLKQNKGTTSYELNGVKLSNSIDKAIKIVEKKGLEAELKEATITLWESIEAKFDKGRKPRYGGGE